MGRGELEGQGVGGGEVGGWEWYCKCIILLSDVRCCLASQFMYMVTNLFQPY